MPHAADAPRGSSAAWAIATFLGVGHFPFASGTVATAAAVPVWLAAWYAGGHAAVVGLAVALMVAGVAASGAMEGRFGYHDPSEVVIDEVAGFMVAMILVEPGLVVAAAGFLLFRAFDVLKPWPASRAESLPGGWGIMADDLICGVLTNLVLHVGLWWWA